jgi:hypothetical protein
MLSTLAIDVSLRDAPPGAAFAACVAIPDAGTIMASFAGLLQAREAIALRGPHADHGGPFTRQT